MTTAAHPAAPAATPGLQEFLRLTPNDAVRDQVAGIIDWHARHHPRHLQKELGPSEIGHPCSRKLIYHIIDAPTCNPGFDVLPSEIGIAMHARMEEHLLRENMRLGRERYLTETRVEVWPGLGENGGGALTGSADCYDTDQQRVIDWKVLGDASRKHTELHGPITSYRRQLQMYGKGFERLGYPVKSVAMVVIPKSGTTHGIRAYVYDYDPTIADKVQDRWHRLIVLADVLEVEQHPERMEAVEAVAEHCEFCPWFSRTPDGSGLQCPGPGLPMNPTK